MDVTLLIDNGLGMGAAVAQVRTGAKGFFAALPEGSQLSLLTLAPQPRWLLRPTNSREGALRAVDRIVPDESRARFLDALIEAGERMGKQSEGRAPVIVAIGSNAPDGSTALEQHFNKLARQLVEYRRLSTRPYSRVASRRRVCVCLAASAAICSKRSGSSSQS